MKKTTMKHKGVVAAIIGWLGLLATTLAAMAFFERQQLFMELQSEAAILYRQASQRADQHDAHLTSLSAIAVAEKGNQQGVFLNVADTIRRFYPRITAINLVPLDRADADLTTQSGQFFETVIAAANASRGELMLRALPQANGQYLAIKRSPNTTEARYGLAISVDAERLLASDNDFWARPSVTRSLRLPDGTLLIGEGSRSAAISFRHALSSGSQPLLFEAGISPSLTDFLPADRTLLVALGMTLFYLLALLGWRQLVRTRRAEQQAQLSASEAQLAHATRVNALGEMASGMAHELTQPLTAILSQAQAGRHLARRGDMGGSEESFSRIVEQAKRAAAILDRLRDWTQPHAERAELVPLNKAIENVEALLHRELEMRGVSLMTDLAHTQGVSLYLDRIALEQIIFNLTRNAVEAAENSPEARVMILSAMTKTRIMLEIIDSGSGVPDAIRARIFEPFVTGKVDGTGLGLALCQRLAEHMGGELSLIEDRPETVFCLWLPRCVEKNKESLK
ncbi:sensor histidine kinase [Halomonas halocynthiae]|uniref:sensor histidine kinase n=1 Tax=Halomonas halocynthiae TaxID=176290 RepID=UPI001469B1B8|nr:ATP-binding protein [Halomonas halocynthiae]